MEDLKCNNLGCRKLLVDRAVVTTCSHIFCLDCANALFTEAQLCPACEASLNEPDDVVIASLRPTNDYKTVGGLYMTLGLANTIVVKSVLSGLSPGIILEICGRAISFWQYQAHQENVYQQAIMKNLNEKASQMSQQLENMIREANSEITLLNNRLAGLEQELASERRKTKDAQVALREKDKEYQKLKNQLDKTKRKVLLGSNAFPATPLGGGPISFSASNSQGRHDHSGISAGIQQAQESIEINRGQRTPLKSNASTGFSTNWPVSANRQQYSHQRVTSFSENIENEEGILGQLCVKSNGGAIHPGINLQGSTRRASGFRPAVFAR